MSASTTSTPALDLHLVNQAPASCSRVLNCYSLRGDPCTRRDEGLLYISNRQRDGEEETWPFSVQGTTGSDNERDRVEERGDTLRPSAVNFLGAIPFLEIARFIWIFQLLNTGLQFALCRWGLWNLQDTVSNEFKRSIRSRLNQGPRSTITGSSNIPLNISNPRHESPEMEEVTTI